MHAKLGPKGIVKRSRRDKIIYGPHADLCTLVVSRISGSVRRAGSETTCPERDSLGTRIQCLHFPLIFHRTSSGKNVVIVNSLSGIYPKQNKTKQNLDTALGVLLLACSVGVCGREQARVDVGIAFASSSPFSFLSSPSSSSYPASKLTQQDIECLRRGNNNLIELAMQHANLDE